MREAVLRLPANLKARPLYLPYQDLDWTRDWSRSTHEQVRIPFYDTTLRRNDASSDSGLTRLVRSGSGH